MLQAEVTTRHCHLLIQKPKHLTKAQLEKQFTNYGKKFAVGQH